MYNVEKYSGRLPFVKRYIKLLNGRSDFESEEGKGTTFFFDIPLPAPENA